MPTVQGLSDDDMVNMRRNVASISSQAIGWVATDPALRNQTALPLLVASVTETIIELRALELSIPAQTFAQLHIHLTHVQDMLKAAQRTPDTLMGPIGRSQTDRAWEKGELGRWRLECPETKLRDLHRLGMSDKKLMKHLQVSESTLQRWKKKYGLRRSDRERLSLEEVLAEVQRCRKEGGGMEGYRYVQGAFKRKNLKVPRQAVRKAIRELDTEDARRRFAVTCVRRVYEVPFANSLWHIDGHHKLIDVKIVIHGGIDGKSRKIAFLKASTNNRAETVFDSFREAVERMGLPSRVRADYGKENLAVKRFMEEHRGLDHHAFIQGPSTRNQRIERFWVELQWMCTWRYRQLFDDFKQKSILSVDNPFDIWCLHLCYLPMLNESLWRTQQDFNGHKMDDMGGDTPDIMWWDSERRLMTARVRGSLMKGVLDAEARGIDILADPEAILGEELAQGLDNDVHRPLGFAEYGLDDYGQRPEGHISDDDPLVDVQPVLGRVPDEIVDRLEQRGFQDALLAKIGPWALGMDDMGESRFVQCRAALDEFLRSAFPAFLPQI